MSERQSRKISAVIGSLSKKDKVFQLGLKLQLLFILFLAPIAGIAQFTAVTSGDWNDGATWGNTSPGVVGTDYPGSGDDAIIPATTSDFIVTVTGTEVCDNLTIGTDPTPANDSDAMLLISASGQLTVNSDVTMPQITRKSSENILDVGDGIVTIDGDLICEASSNGNKGSKDSRIYVGDGTLTITGDATFNEIDAGRQYFEFLGDGIINFNGDVTAHKDALKLTAVGNLSTVNFTGTGYGIPFDDFDFIEISGSGTYSNASAALFNIRSNFTISGSSRFDVVDQNMEVALDFICTSSAADPFIERTYTVIFDGGSTTNLTHTVSGGNTLTFYDVQIGGTANNRKVEMQSGSITMNDMFFTASKRNLAFRIDGGDLTIATGITLFNQSTSGSNILRVNAGSLTVPSITMEPGLSNSPDTKFEVLGGTANIAGDIIMEGDNDNNFVTMEGISTSLTVGGSITGGQFNNSATGTSLLKMDGTGAQLLGGTGGFLGGDTYDIPSLEVDGPTLTLGNVIDVEGNVSISDGSLDVSASNFTLSVDGDWSNSVGAGGFIAQNGTVDFDGGQTQNLLTKEVFYNLEVSNSNTDLIIGAGTNTTSFETNILDGGAIEYSGTAFVTGSMNIESPSTGPSEFTGNTNGVSISTLTLSGKNSDYYHNGGTATVTGATVIYSSDNTNANVIEISAGTLNMNTLEMDSSATATASNSRDARLLLSGTGNADINGEITMRSQTARNYIELTGSGDLRVASHIRGGDLKVNGGTGTTYFDGAGTQNIAGDASGTLEGGDSYVFTNVQIENTSVSNLQDNIQVEDLTFSANGTLDCRSATLKLRGDFTINGALADPFNENNGTVTFNGNASFPTQTMENLVGSGLTFRRLRINNSSGLAVGVQTNNDIYMTIYDHDIGVFSLLNNDLTLAGAGNETSTLVAGSIITNGPASTFTYTDPALTHTLYFDGHDGTTQTFFIGDATNGIDITGTDVGDVEFDGADIYGNVSFTRNKSTSNNTCSGGMIFRNNVTLTVNTGSDRWRLADRYPDIYYGTLDVTHNGKGNFIIGRASIGNEYHGKVTLFSSTTAGVYVGRDNIARPNSNTFYADFEAVVSSTGAIIVGNGDSDSPSTVVFDGGDIIFKSTVTSTGNIEFGEDEDNFSQITLQNGAKFNTPAGNVLGTTEIRISNVDQRDASVTNSIELTSGARLALGYDAISTSGNNWAGDIDFTAPRIISMVYNNFAGMSNNFTKTGAFGDGGTTIGSNANGFNTFAVGSNTTFNNTSTALWRLGVYGGNDYDGNVTYVASAGGAINPCYDATSTYSGNISTVGSGQAIIFAEGASGLMEIDGTGAMTLDGDDAFAPIVDKLLMDGVGANLDLEVDLKHPFGGYRNIYKWYYHKRCHRYFRI